MGSKMRTKNFSLGWQRDLPDHRDFLCSAPLAQLKALPPKVDLRKGCPPVYNQGDLGSCTANPIAGAVQFDRRKAKQKPDFVLSRLFIYYNERVIEHTIHHDAGAQLRDGIKAVAKQGVCPETEWPYADIAPPNESAPFPANAPAGQKPPAQCCKDAKAYEAASYLRLQQTLAQTKGCLAEGYPFVFGFTVYEKWYDTPRRCCPCQARMKAWSADTPCSPSVTMTASSYSRSATPGALPSATRAISTCPMPT